MGNELSKFAPSRQWPGSEGHRPIQHRLAKQPWTCKDTSLQPCLTNTAEQRGSIIVINTESIQQNEYFTRTVNQTEPSVHKWCSRMTFRRKQSIIVMTLSSTKVNARSDAQTQNVPSINTLTLFVSRYVNAVMEGAVCSLATVGLPLPLLILSSDVRYASMVR